MNSWIAFVTRSLQPPQLTALWLDTAINTLIVLAVAGGVCLAWRRAAASARHLVWFLNVAGALCFPVFSSMVPAWQRPLWTVGTHVGAQNELLLTLEFVPADPAMFSSPAVASPPSAGNSPGTALINTGSGHRLATHFGPRWAILCLSIWFVVAVTLVLSMVVGRFQLGSLRRAARSPLDHSWFELLQALRQQLQIRREVTLLQAPDDVMPVTWGWRRPIILLPAEADAWPADRRRIVLLHELAHIKRWDCLTQMVARLACAVYWFNPLVWVAARRMCIEREGACDDLVLNGGSKPSDYATHLLEIARSLRRVPQVAAIAMARSSNLSHRIEAIVDGARARRAPRAPLVAFCCVAALGLVASIAGQRVEARSAPGAGEKPWFDARLRAFFAAKGAQARRLADGEKVAPEVWLYFKAGVRGDWAAATNLWVSMRKRAHQYEGTTPDATLDKVWSPILETDLLWEQFANWRQKYVLKYGQDIITSIAPGSIYFGGTDPGRGVITGMSTSHAEGIPFYTLTQNALADMTYLDYLQAMYGHDLSLPTHDDSQGCFQEYVQDAAKRLAEDKLKPNENVRQVEGKVQVSGQVAVMSINALLVKIIFDRNPDREFYVEESFPLEWMYPHLTPNGLIMKINRQPLASLPADLVEQDHQYWSHYLQPMLGDWPADGTSVAELTAFAEKVYLQHDLAGFTGDPEFVADSWSPKAFSKLRSSIGGLYFWRMQHAQAQAEYEQMKRETEFAFSQAYALCPTSSEAVLRYVKFLLATARPVDASLLVQTTLKIDPDNASLRKDLDETQKLIQQAGSARPN